jgi:hypothetical protein
MTIALFNPTATSAVIDTTFFTARGPIQPEPDEGIVVPPGQVVAIDVGTYVQDQNAVATVVSAQSGRIVASELWTYSSAGQQGLSLEVGAPALSSNWSIPLTQDVAPGPAGALTQLDVFNPRSSPERVDVTVRTPSGSLAPFVATVAPETTWHLRTDQATRIPPGTDYAVSVRASGGAGVVVSRTVALPSTTAPQWGTTPAVAALPRGFGGLAGPNVDRTGPLGRHAVRWVLPAPATPAGAVVAGASPSALSVQNLSKRELDVQVSALVHGKVHSLGRLGRLRIGPGRFAYLDSARLNAVALDPLEVETSGLASVTEDLVPAAGYGVVTTAAVPLS